MRPSRKSNRDESALERSEGWPLQGGGGRPSRTDSTHTGGALTCCIRRSEQGNPP